MILGLYILGILVFLGLLDFGIMLNFLVVGLKFCLFNVVL